MALLFCSFIIVAGKSRNRRGDKEYDVCVLSNRYQVREDSKMPKRVPVVKINMEKLTVESNF